MTRLLYYIFNRFHRRRGGPYLFDLVDIFGALNRISAHETAAAEKLGCGFIVYKYK